MILFATSICYQTYALLEVIILVSMVWKMTGKLCFLTPIMLRGMLLIQYAAMALLQNSVGETCPWEGEPWH